jgi:tetratricopeptide (TPR) repeat protein
MLINIILNNAVSFKIKKMRLKNQIQNIKNTFLRNWILVICFSGLIFSSESANSQNTAYDNYLNAIEQVKLGNFSDALVSINNSLVKEPENHEYLAYKGYILRNNNDFENALSCMEKAIEINSKVGWYYVEAVVSAYNLQDLELSKKYCENAITFGKENLGTSNFDYVNNLLENLKTVEYILDFKFNPTNKSLVYEGDGTLCIPVPSTDLDYQKTIYKITNATLIKSEKDNDFELIYIKPTGKSEVSVLCTITKIPYSYSLKIENANASEEIPVEVEKYLESSDRVNLNSDIIKSTAKPLKSSTDLETIKNIINWVNSSKSYAKVPPVWSAVDDIIKSKTVECATGSLAVVALARACGIPARQVWGPINAGIEYSPENYLKGHVWFEFYLRGSGWIPVDQFDISTIGLLPTSYIRMMTSDTHLFDNIPLGNIMTIMHNETYGDIIEFNKTVKNDD